MASAAYPPNIPARACTPEVFRTLYRLNARTALKLDETLYLCAMRAAGAAQAEALEHHLETHLYGGELYCQMEPGLYYMQVYARDEAAVQVLLCDITDCLPRVRTQYKAVTKRD